MPPRPSSPWKTPCAVLVMLFLAGLFFPRAFRNFSPQSAVLAQGGTETVATPVSTPPPYATPRISRTPRVISTPRAPRPSPTPKATPSADRKRAAPGVPPGVRPGQKVERFEQAAPSKTGKAATGAKEVPPTLRFGKDAVLTCLHFTPLDLQVRPGETFRVSVSLNNRSSRSVDGLDLVLAYDPQRLTFLESAPSAALQAAAPREKPELTHKTGRLLFSCLLDAPIQEEGTELFDLTFRASETSGFTTLRFLTPPDGATAVWNQGENLLGDETQKLRGVIHSYVFISSAPSSELLPAEEDDPTTGAPDGTGSLWTMPGDALTTDPLQSGWLYAPPNARPEAGAFLSLQGPVRREFAPGETFWVDLVLHNEDLVPIESVGVNILFDAAALQVLDQDAGNWITSGINVWDGAFHEDYPFDFHRANRADNARGEILYQTGRQYGVWAFPTGVFARVKFRVRSDINPATAIRLVRAAQRGRPQTYIRSFGIDRMEDFWEKKPPAPVWIRIRPASPATVKSGAPFDSPNARATSTKTPSAR